MEHGTFFSPSPDLGVEHQRPGGQSGVREPTYVPIVKPGHMLSKICIYFGLSPFPVIVEMKVYRDSLLKME